MTMANSAEYGYCLSIPARLMARQAGARIAAAADFAMARRRLSAAYPWGTPSGGAWFRRRGAMPIIISRLAYGGFIIDLGKMP